MVIGVACRVGPTWHTVHAAAGDVRLLESDPWFHARHATIVARHPLHLARFDIATNFPYGERGLNQGLYDIALGGIAVVYCGLRPDAMAVARVAAWVPVVVTALSYLALFVLVRRLSSDGWALLAVALMVFYPGFSLPYTLLGFADHHAVEIALALWSAIGVVASLDAPARWNPLAPLPLALFLFTWAGAPIFLLFTIMAFLAAGLAQPTAASAAVRYATLLGLLYGIPAWLWPDLIMFTDGHLATCCGLVALLTVVPGLVWARHALRGPRHRGAVAIIGVATAAAVVAVMSPVGRWALAFLLRPGNPFIAEERPVTRAAWFIAYGPLAILGPLGMVLTTWAVVRGRISPRWTVPLCFGVPLLGLWLWTSTYNYAPACWLALFGAQALHQLLTGMPRSRCVLLCVGVVLVGLLLAPLGWVHRPWPTAFEVQSLTTIDDAWVNTLRWMHDETPRPALDIVQAHDADTFQAVSGFYGVMTSWDYGHWVAFLAERPVVVSETLYRTPAKWWIYDDEPVALRNLTGDVRYFIVDARMDADFAVAELTAAGKDVRAYLTAGPVTPYGRPDMFGAAWNQTMLARLYEGDADGLSHLRLVYESPQQSLVAYYGARRPNGVWQCVRHADVLNAPRPPGLFRFGEQIRHEVKLFERVVGARLQGRATAGSTVRAAIPLDCGGRALRHGVETRADSDGHFVLTVPWPTAHVPFSAVQPQGPWTVEVDGRSLPVQVTDSQVGGGETVDVPAADGGTNPSLPH